MVHRCSALGHHRSAIELLAYSKGGDIEGYGYGNPKIDALFEQIDCADISYAQEGLMEQGWRSRLRAPRAYPAALPASSADQVSRLRQLWS